VTLTLTPFGQTNNNNRIKSFKKETKIKLRQEKIEDQFDIS